MICCTHTKNTLPTDNLVLVRVQDDLHGAYMGLGGLTLPYRQDDKDRQDRNTLHFSIVLLAGYSNAEIAPLFAEASGNCSLPDEWKAFCTKPTYPRSSSQYDGSVLQRSKSIEDELNR